MQCSAACLLLLQLLLIACALISTDAARYQPALRGLLHIKKTETSVSAASSYHDDYSTEATTEIKEFCMLEIEQTACASVDPVLSWSSEFACCQEDEQYAGYSKPQDLRSSLPLGAAQRSGVIGSCDWTFLLYPDQVQVSPSAFKFGNSWATCWLNAGADTSSCGGAPMRNRMVYTLQGTAYIFPRVYSYWGMSNGGGLCIGPRMAGRFSGLKSNGTSPTAPPQAAKPNVGSTRAGMGNSLLASLSSRMNAAPTSTGHARNPTAQVQYSHLGQDAPQDNRQVFRGGAFMVSGAVTSMAGADRQHWDEGVFSYTPFYISFGAETGPIDPTLPWVRDKTYKFTFYRHSDKYSEYSQ